MRMQRLARFLLARAVAVKRPPDFLVGGEANPYLRRWYVIPRNRLINVYLHNMLRDDDDVLHDHPWWSVSLALSGGLVENFQEAPPAGELFLRVVEQGDVIVRSPTMAHQLVVAHPAWTLFVTGPVTRTWGFWCPKGWRPWKDNVQLNNGVSTAGRGCGEQQ